MRCDTGYVERLSCGIRYLSDNTRDQRLDVTCKKTTHIRVNVHMQKWFVKVLLAGRGLEPEILCIQSPLHYTARTTSP